MVFNWYSGTLSQARGHFEQLIDALAAQPAGLADDLRGRSEALGKVRVALQETADDLEKSGLLGFPVVGYLWFDLNNLADRIGGLQAELGHYANVVGGRRQMYAAELQRIANEAKRLAASKIWPGPRSAPRRNPMTTNW